MDTYFDLDSRQFIGAANDRRALARFDFKRGDTLNIAVRFVRAGVVQELGGGASGKFGVKETGEYSADFITADSSWSKTGTGTSTVYTFALPLNTSELNALLTGDTASVTLMAEMQVTDGAEVYSSNTVPVLVLNDVIKDDETGPTVITGGTPVNQVTATSTLTVNNLPEANDTLIITVGATVETWTFVAGSPAANQIQIGASEADTATNIITELGDSALVDAVTGGSGVVNLTAAVSGAVGQHAITGTAISGGDATESAAVAAVTATSGYLGTMKVDASFLYVVASLASGVPTWKKISLSTL